MWQYFSSADPIAVIVIVGGLVIGLVAVISAFAVRVYRMRTDAALTQQLLDQGLTADEIATILRARNGLDEGEE